jgi:thiol-disulfide isomerase/thioredoxin
MLAALAWTLASTAKAADVTGGRVPSPREGFLAPGFKLDLLSGGSVELSELRGKVVVINLWASWCPPCRAEMPAIQRVYEGYKDRGLEVIAVNTTFQDSEVEVAAFVDELLLTFPIALDRTGEVSNRYLLRALPTTFFVDAEGVIQKIVIGGPMSETLIRTSVEGLLGENS